MALRHHGMPVSGAELIGLIPEEVYEPESDWVRLINRV